jgi:hypothetical protein
MSREGTTETLAGSLQRLLFSPKGSIEGLLLKVDGELVQVSIKADVAPAAKLASAVGQPIRVAARRDRSPKTVMFDSRVIIP